MTPYAYAAHVDQRVSCSNCGHEFPPGYAAQADRVPCPDCGGQGLSVELHVADEINVAMEVSIGVGPSQHLRMPARRWAVAAAELASLEHPLRDAEHDTLFEAQRRLHHVFIDLWALREAMIHAGVAKQVVNSAIKNDPTRHGLGPCPRQRRRHGPLRSPP